MLDVENLAKVSEFAFTYDDYSKILHDIKSQAFRNFDGLVKENEIEFDELKILEKIILFVKSFVRFTTNPSADSWAILKRTQSSLMTGKQIPCRSPH